MTPYWQVVAGFHVEPPAADWRDQLAARLGARPRRIGVFAELALYGAMECLSVAAKPEVPAAMILRLGSRSCAATATREMVLQRLQGGMPMPFTFLQSQPAQTLAALSHHLRWQGDAVFHISESPLAVLRLACMEAGAEGLLFGWVDDLPAPRCHWLRLRPSDERQLDWQALQSLPADLRYLRVDADGLSGA